MAVNVLMSQLIPDPLKCSILQSCPEDRVHSLIQFDLGSLPTSYPTDAVTSTGRLRVHEASLYPRTAGTYIPCLHTSYVIKSNYKCILR